MSSLRHFVLERLAGFIGKMDGSNSACVALHGKWDSLDDWVKELKEIKKEIEDFEKRGKTNANSGS